jgi:tetratricopeptide (TPR) repeat protein
VIRSRRRGVPKRIRLAFRLGPATAGMILSGCMLTTPAFEPPEPQTIAQLETRWSRDSSDLRSALRLAAGRLATGDVASAEAVLQEAHDQVPSDGTVAAILGIVEHEMEDWAQASEHYRHFLELQAESPIAPLIVARLDAITPRVRSLEALSLVAGEPEAPSFSGSTEALIVLPFTHDPELSDGAPRGVALGELLAADFARVRRNVVDPARGRALLNALGLSPTEPLSMGGAARIGALLDARSVVFGRMIALPSGRVRVETSVLHAVDDGLEILSIPLEGAWNDLLDLQKRLAFVLLGEVVENVRLNDAMLVAQKDIDSPRAMTTYGRGLAHRDAGRHAEAEADFASAADFQPGFSRLAELAARSAAARRIEALSATALTVDVARVGELRRAVQAHRARAGSAESAARARVGASERGVISEILGFDGLGGSIPVEIVFFLPVGGP